MAPSQDNADEQLNNFIAKAPAMQYTFDSERDAPQSEICREGGERGRECMTIHMHSKRLFEAMQNHGFYCALPIDPSQTYIKCTPMPKS
ncbi:hypothetical protein DENSPDRAFT_883130 [Dentipellis sp. KUC8613]|nr:hypothetical protein DENSPDRAFT_883130 [Dentipellis sp. KUC8613]